MKKTLYLIICFLMFFGVRLNASHLMGGQITALRLDTFKYAVDLTLYRDTDGIPIASMDVINYYEDSLGTWKLDSIHWKQVDAGAYFINGTEVYHYYDTVVFSHYGKFLISWQNCCRNFAILNMSNPGGENLYLQTILTVDSITPNSTPVFLNAPVTLAQKNMYWNYNPLPYDADGDSIAWKLVTPLSYGGISPVAGYSIPRCNPLQPFVLDTITGQISWMPDTIGHFVASFLVSEFRNGQKIGEIRRDMQIIVVDDSTNNNGLKFVTNSLPINTQGYFEVPLYAGRPSTLTVVATDLDSDYCNLTAVGETFLLSQNPSTLNVVPGNGVVTATFSWTPSWSNIRSQNYMTVFRGDELHGVNHFLTDLTVGFKVLAWEGTTNLKKQVTSTVYPNPATDKIVLSYESNISTNGSLRIVNMAGQEMLGTVLKSQVGQNNVLIDLGKWPAGLYKIVLQHEAEVFTQTVVKQ